MKPWKKDGSQAAAAQLSHQRVECPHAVQHHGQPQLLGQRQLFAQQAQLFAPLRSAHEVEPRLADGLHVRRQRQQLRCAAARSLPRMDARRAQFDARARGAVGVYVYQRCAHDSQK